MPENQQVQQSKKPDTTFQKQATPVSQTPASNPYSIIQRAKINPKSLTHADVMQLQRTIGNRVVGRLFSGIGSISTAQQAPVQRQEIPEEEEPLQGKMIGTIQCQEIPEEEEPLQGKFESIQRQEIPEEEEPLQGKFESIQRQEPEEEELMQGKFTDECVQCQMPEEEEETLQGKFASGLTGTLQAKEEAPPNKTGMPDHLKSGIENISGMDLSGVRVHYNSSKPEQLNALAYAQGNDIHIAPGQEKYLSHEAWHVVQQAQGRVRVTGEVGGIPLNDSRTLESEADAMGRKALQQYARVEKPKGNKSRAVANSVGKKNSNVKQGFGFVDNRPETIAQKIFLAQTIPQNSLNTASIQCKKTTKPDNAELLALIPGTVETSVISGKGTDTEKGDAIWTKLNSEYDACKTKGKEYWASLETKIVDYKDVGKKAALINALDVKRVSNSAKFGVNYSNTIENTSGSKYRVNTEGYDPTSSAKPVVSTGKYKGDYSNEFDVQSGEIKAAWNFAEYDKARQAGKGINNSEILYRQFKEAAKEHYKADLDKDTKVGAAVKRISKITRDNIINATTNAVIYTSYPNGKKPSDEDKTWGTATDEFKAILGTPNAKSSPFMLMDHLDEMEKTIDNIETKGGTNLDINFKDI